MTVSERFFQIINSMFEQGQHPVPTSSRLSVSRQVASKLEQIAKDSIDLQQFTNQAVNLIREQFGFYFVCINLLNRQQNFAVFHAGSGEIGAFFQARGHHIPVESQGIIGTALQLPAVAVGDPITDGFLVCRTPLNSNLAPRLSPEFMPDIPATTPDPFLPDSKSEIVLPLRTQRGVVGVLDIHSCVPDDFGPLDITVLLPLADQIAEKCGKLLSAE
jgi:GAF domain-containing protein